MASAGSPGISRSRKNVTSVMPNSRMTSCASRRGNEPNRLTGCLPRRLVLPHRQGFQGQVVVAERGDVEALHPAADAVAVRAVVDDQVGRLRVDDLLDLGVLLGALAAGQV